MARADSIFTGGQTAGGRRAGQAGRPVRTSSTTIYVFFIGSDSNFYYEKSTDNGFTWGLPVAIKTGVSILGFASWYDKWTPSDSGTKIHLAYFETTNDDVFYRSLDTASDTLGTEATVLLGSTLAAVSDSCISIAKMRGGNLLILGDFDGGTEKGLFRSVDAGANWTVRTDPTEGSDYHFILPGFAADNQDAIIIFWDRSASELSRKVYDDSADSTAETSISGSMTAIATDTCSPQFAVTVDATNSRIVLIAWTNRDTLNADLKTWWITESAITAKTDVVTDSTDDQQMCALALATDTSTFYAFYGGKSDGSETAGTSINIYYKTSADSGVTWGSETLLTNYSRNYDTLVSCLTFTGDFVVMYESNESTLDNMFLSVPIPSAAASGGQGWWGG